MARGTIIILNTHLFPFKEQMPWKKILGPLKGVDLTEVKPPKINNIYFFTRNPAVSKTTPPHIDPQYQKKILNVSFGALCLKKIPLPDSRRVNNEKNVHSWFFPIIPRYSTTHQTIKHLAFSNVFNAFILNIFLFHWSQYAHPQKFPNNYEHYTFHTTNPPKNI